MRRIAVTGIGLITSIGNGRESFWHNLIAGVHGIGPVQMFDTSQHRTHLGGEVKEFRAGDYISTLDTASLA
ncbi:MAG TPA: beta-ketoacyl-ACP synthase, partial [Candidatus Latescibacteria bacterium]|nr:beta-ketoacyl-ACP synthase [Candidatus Latescibacterota bacterium]